MHKLYMTIIDTDREKKMRIRLMRPGTPTFNAQDIYVQKMKRAVNIKPVT